MREYIFGANILENLTTGMYKDSKVIYREYIQNSCDQIDKAVKDGILLPQKAKIDIWLDYDRRTISIEDNATGIPASEFERTLGNIADSDKKIGEDKGFRGIGRLCGLAYCNQLVFTSSAKGENIISIMTCDAEKMRRLIVENVLGQKHTASDVLHAINSFETQYTKDRDSHFFKVELIGINDENTDLLDFQQVKDYLSFVAPVPYQNSFIYRTEVYNHAKVLGVKLDEYTIKLDGEQIFKKYNTILKESNGTKYDDIFGVEFKDFYDDNSNLFAWMWIGLSQFCKAIPKINQMRGLRLRKENIQIGGEDSLQKLFKQDRGNSYFVGEVFAVSRDLIPNSQRDYFNENTTRAYFESKLRRFFDAELHKIYYDGSAINSAYRKIDTYEQKEVNFRLKEENGAFVDDEHRKGEYEIVLAAKNEANTAQTKIEKMKDNADGLMSKVINRIEKERRPQKTTIKTPHVLSEDVKPPRRTKKLSAYNKHEQKLIAKIFSIIYRAIDNDIAEMIIRKIEDELQ